MRIRNPAKNPQFITCGFTCAVAPAFWYGHLNSFNFIITNILCNYYKEETLCHLDFRWARWSATTSLCACSMPGASRMGSRSSRPASLRTPTISRYNYIPHFVACIKSLEFERNESYFNVGLKKCKPSLRVGSVNPEIRNFRTWDPGKQKWPTIKKEKLGIVMVWRAGSSR